MKTLDVRVAPDGLARLEMARPEVFNAFDETMILELGLAFSDLGLDPRVQTIALTSKESHSPRARTSSGMKRASVAGHANILTMVDASPRCCPPWRTALSRRSRACMALR